MAAYPSSRFLFKTCAFCIHLQPMHHLGYSTQAAIPENTVASPMGAVGGKRSTAASNVVELIPSATLSTATKIPFSSLTTNARSRLLSRNFCQCFPDPRSREHSHERSRMILFQDYSIPCTQVIKSGSAAMFESNTWTPCKCLYFTFSVHC